MFAYLNGTIQKKLPKNIILTVNDVGYLVSVPNNLFERLKEKQKIELYLYTKVREDDISLYGFETVDELEFFKLLLNVNGIGPKLAMEILSQNIDKAKIAIMNGDIAFLSSISGIGKKTAERILVELKGKVTVEDISRIHTGLEKDLDDEIIEALENLGYQRFEIVRKLKKIPETLTTSEEIITHFLRNV